MGHFRSASLGVVIAGACAAAMMVACGDDASDEASQPAAEAGTDGATTIPDGAVPPSGNDAATADGAAVDASNDASGDAGSDAPSGDASPPITSALGPTGVFELTNSSVVGRFFEDGTIVRMPAHPQCVIHVHTRTKVPSLQGGPIVVGGPVVGAEGGPAAPINLTADPLKGNQYIDTVGPVFGDSSEFQVQIQGNGSPTFPPLTAQLLRPFPIASVTTVTKPVKAATGPTEVISTASLDIVWTAAAGAQADHRLIVALGNISKSESPQRAELRCAYPLSAGQASIPKELLTELRNRVTPANANNPTGSMRIWAGGQAEVSAGGQSYVIELARRDSTTFATGDTGIVLK